jgi:hypothetical protein
VIWAAIVARLLGLANILASYFKSKQDHAAGAALQRDADHTKTMEVLKDVGAPVPIVDRDELWERNKAKFGADGSPSG